MEPHRRLSLQLAAMWRRTPLLGSEIGVPRILGFRWPDFDEAELHLEWLTIL